MGCAREAIHERGFPRPGRAEEGNGAALGEVGTKAFEPVARQRTESDDGDCGREGLHLGDALGRAEIGDEIPEEIVGHRPRRRDVLDLQRNGVGLHGANPNWQHPLVVRVTQDDDRHVRHRIDHQTLDRHFEQHGSPRENRNRDRGPAEVERLAA